MLSVSSDTLLFGDDAGKNDVRRLTERLERLTPEQFAIADAMLSQRIAAFSLR